MPEVTAYGVGSLKSTHDIVVLMFAALDCSSSAPGELPLTAYKAVLQFPADVPLIYAIMSVTDPEVVQFKYEMDWILALL